jgi:hypothetical protein
LEEGFE